MEEEMFNKQIQNETLRAFEILKTIVHITEDNLDFIKKKKVYKGITRFDPTAEMNQVNCFVFID